MNLKMILLSDKGQTKADIGVACACYPRALQEAEAGGLRVQTQPGQLSDLVRSGLKNQKSQGCKFSTKALDLIPSTTKKFLKNYEHIPQVSLQRETQVGAGEEGLPEGRG